MPPKPKEIHTRFCPWCGSHEFIFDMIFVCSDCGRGFITPAPERQKETAFQIGQISDSASDF